MKIINKDVSIIPHIIAGSVEIKSSAEFEQILEIFPDNPELHKAFGDYLLSEKKFFAATSEYRVATSLFFEAGMALQAIGSKLREWKIVEPRNRDRRAFYVALQQTKPSGAPLDECLAKMSCSEASAIFKKMELVSLPAGELVRKAGDEELALYMIVSGSLIDSISKPVADKGKDSSVVPVGHLAENYFFGDIYPFKERKKSELYVQTTSKVELIKINKPDLMTICGHYPDVETGLKVLSNYYLRSGRAKAFKVMRQTSRQQLSIKMTTRIYPHKSGLSPLVLKGYSSDISLGGVSVTLDPKYRDIPSAAMLGRTVKVTISLTDETVSMSILGTLAWSKEFTIDNERVGALGIKFNEMPPSLRGMLLIFANAIGRVKVK
ncbi:MAG: PilZ domain-containing protein [Proteobacteria bacterium]|nr:PilZ domain-containing protein [Pseudomonadota bacterium]MBU1717377.1 PilZ domain-containing protein [Pseudomonadota bacterium]